MAKLQKLCYSFAKCRVYCADLICRLCLGGVWVFFPSRAKIMFDVGKTMSYVRKIMSDIEKTTSELFFMLYML